MLATINGLHAERNRVQAENAQLLSSLNNLQNEIFILRKPSNSNLNSCFPTLQEVLANYTELMEQDVLNYVSDFGDKDPLECVTCVSSLIEFISEDCRSHFLGLVRGIAKRLQFSSYEQYYSSGIYHEVIQHLKRNYKSFAVMNEEYTDYVTKKFEKKRKAEQETLLGLANKMITLMWELYLSGLVLSKSQSKSNFRSIGNRSGMEVVIFKPIRCKDEVVKHGYIFKV